MAFFYCFVGVFGLAWLVTIIANTGRIVISIKFLPLLTPYIEYAQSHLLLGIFIYVTMLILYYLRLNFFVGRGTRDESRGNTNTEILIF